VLFTAQLFKMDKSTPYSVQLHCFIMILDCSMQFFKPLRWRCIECVSHHKQDVREKQ